ncbi:MAG: cupin domain-containing protein [Actinomycetota bacterium]
MEDLRVIRAGDRTPDQASGAMVREAAISGGLVGAERIWFGYVELPPGSASVPHHHGEAESGIYVISGAARFFTGERLDVEHRAQAGDFVWVPPNVVHVEMNASEVEPVRTVVARSTQETLVFNVPGSEDWTPP